MKKLFLKRFFAVVLFTSVIVAVVGCESMRHFLWMTTPRDKQLVKPEYTLENKKVAVLIYCEEGVLFEYPNIRLTLGSKIAAEMENYVKGVKMLSPLKIAKYQDDHINWDSEDPRKVAKALDVDALIILSLEHYSTREPGLMNTYQGRITAEAKLFEATAADEDPIWETKKSMEITYPKESRVSARLEPLIRDKSESMLAAELARKFYKHKFFVDEHENKVYEASK